MDFNFRDFLLNAIQEIDIQIFSFWEIKLRGFSFELKFRLISPKKFIQGQLPPLDTLIWPRKVVGMYFNYEHAFNHIH